MHPRLPNPAYADRDAHMNELLIHAHKVNVPVGRCGSFAVEHFYIGKDNAENIRLMLHGRTPMEPGLYTKLTEDGSVWMSDTPEEIETHMPAFNRFADARGEQRVLIHGLGLGMVLQDAIRAKGIIHVDVVEINGDVIDLVGPHYYRMAQRKGVYLNLVQGDCFTYQWPRGTKWFAVWHDIWEGYGEDNLPEMAILKRKFGHRTGWQGCWGQDMCRRIRDGRYRRNHQRIMDRFHKAMGIPTDAALRTMFDQMEAKHAGSNRGVGGGGSDTGVHQGND